MPNKVLKQKKHQFTSNTHNSLRTLLSIAVLLGVLICFSVGKAHIFSREAINTSYIWLLLIGFLIDLILGVFYQEFPTITGVVSKKNHLVFFRFRMTLSIIAVLTLLTVILWGNLGL